MSSIPYSHKISADFQFWGVFLKGRELSGRAKLERTFAEHGSIVMAPLSSAVISLSPNTRTTCLRGYFDPVSG
jgi:hypothetical protein